MVTSQIEQCLTGVDGGRQKKRGGEWSEGNDHRRVRARFTPCFSLSPNKSPATQASVSHFQIGDWGRWKEKKVFLFLSRIPPSFSSFARVLVDFQKKKRKRVCAGHGCSNAPIVSTVNPLLSPPLTEDSFFSDSFEGRLNTEGGLIYLEKTVVSVLY